MPKIEANGFLYAQHVSVKNDLQPLGQTQWFGKETSPLQGSLMRYDAGKAFRTHNHILNPRLINKTQECFIVARGRLKVTIFIKEQPSGSVFVHENAKGQFYYSLGSLIAEQGDAIFVWGGFHKIEILDNDTVAYEIKAGQFNGIVSEDKEFLDE